MSGLWLMMAAGGLLTFATRLSFILLLDRWMPPHFLQRALRFVPPAVLSAIIVPELLQNNGGLVLTGFNPRLLAGILAGLVAWRTRSVLLTVAVGMAALLLIQRLF